MRRGSHNAACRLCVALSLLALAAAPAKPPQSRPATRPAAPARNDAPASVETDPIGDPPPEVRLAQARRVAFVCVLGKDTSAEKARLLREELDKGLSALKPVQALNIVFAGERWPQALFPDGTPLPATPDNRKRASAFLEKVTFPAKPDPLPALAIAFAGKPDVVYLLTGGDFADNEAVVKKVAELNAKKTARVATVYFSPEKYNPATEETLQRIARESGGPYRCVFEEDLKKE